MRYRIKTVERLTGLSRSTITAWERRYRLLEPGRDPSGYRVYTQADLELLQRVKALREAGYALPEAIADARSVIPGEGRRVQGEAEGDRGLTLRREVREGLLAFDREAAERAHEGALALPFRRRLESIYLPLLQELGEGWARGEITVAQEHFASAFCHEQLVGMLQALAHGPEGGTVALCAGFPGESHELPLLAVALELALRGFKIVWLGPEVPLPALAAAIGDVGPHLVCHTLVMPVRQAEVDAWVEGLRDQADPSVWIAFGGPGAAGLAVEAPRVLMCPTLEDFLQAWAQVGGARI